VVETSYGIAGIPGGEPQRPDRPRGLRRLVPLGVFVGAAGFAAGLTCVYLAMRDLMVEAGGTCASGGPYAVAAGHECGSEAVLIVAGIVALLVFGGLFAASTAASGGPGSGMDAAFLMWAALFGALGFNFLQLGFDPPPTVGGGGAWIVCGIVFGLMALGGLVPLVWSVRELIQRGGAPEESLFRGPIVRANVPPPSATAQPPAEPPPTAPLPKRLNIPQRDWRSP
jgi:hypothetical protein